MQTVWYLSPSNQVANRGVGAYGNERDQMYLLTGEITDHLDRAGVSFHVPERTMTLADRCQESNDMKACFHLAIHSNAGGRGKARGPVAFYYSKEGRQLGEKLVDALLSLGQENNRTRNVLPWKSLFELRRTQAPACLLEVDFHDSEEGVRFLTSRRSEIAEAIARVIIEADGKQFVPVTAGEYAHRAVTLGLFPRGTDWGSPMTKLDCARFALALLETGKRG